jgi:hypothetical protein
MPTLRLVPESGEPIQIDGNKATVGRDGNAEVVISDNSVSRKHALIERWGSNWAVVDQRSANGTFLDGQRITESVLKAGQELRFGKVAYRVEIADADFGATVMMSSPLSDATVVQPVAPRPAPPPRPAPVPGARPAVSAPAPAYVPAPPPYEAHRPEPVESGRGPFFWIGLLVAVLALAGLAGFGVVVGIPTLKSRAAVDAAQAQIKDIAAGDVDAAYSRTAAAYRAAHAAEDFAAFVERHPGLRRNTAANFTSRSVENDSAKLSGTLVHGAGTEGVIYELVKEGGEWKVSGLEVDGDEGKPVVQSSAAGEGLTVNTVAVNKSRQGQTVTVKIDVRATGFALRPEGKVFRVDLAEDLETIGPDGNRVDDLSRANLQTYNQTTRSATDATATFSNSLTFTQPDPGRYKAAITIRDMVGQTSKRHEVPFDLP